jgi:hypothetical protein
MHGEPLPSKSYSDSVLAMLDNLSHRGCIEMIGPPTEITCPLGHKFVILAGTSMDEDQGAVGAEGWTDTDILKVAKLSVLGHYLASGKSDFGHGLFLICPSCGIVFDSKTLNEMLVKK